MWKWFSIATIFSRNSISQSKFSKLCGTKFTFAEIKVADAIDSDRLISFMNAIIKTAAGRRVYLILDNLKVHHSNKVSAWVKEHEAQIRLFHLPPYCPEYNPDEYLNNDLKRNLGTQAMVKTVQELEENATEVLNQFSADTEHVKSNFDHPKLKPYKLDWFVIILLPE